MDMFRTSVTEELARAGAMKVSAEKAIEVSIRHESQSSLADAVPQQRNRTRFVKVSLQSMGLCMQLNHASLHCTAPTPCHSTMVVLHTNGFHEGTFNFCGCTQSLPHHLQLLQRHFYPASQFHVKTCATFELLELLHKLTLTTKSSTYDFYRGLEFLTDGSGLLKKKSRFRALMQMILQWRHLKILLWGGKAHDPLGVTVQGG